MRTGIVIGDGTYILTVNAALMEARTGGNYRFATITYNDGSVATGSILGKNVSKDLAVLKLLTDATHKPLSIDFQGLPAIAETVAILGYPYATIGFPTAYLGIANVRVDTLDFSVKYIETNVVVGPVSGGSPIVSTSGEVIGLLVENTSLLLGDPVPKYAYALSMDDVRKAIQDMGISLS
jgi:S1-C subfamily serine protease